MRQGVAGGAATAFVLFVSVGCEIAAAAETSENKESGFYLGAALSRVEQEAVGEGQMLVAIGLPSGFVATLAPNQVDVDDTDIGWNVTLGYRINKYIAAELAYYDFGEASVTERYTAIVFAAPLNFTARSNIQAFGPGVSLLGRYPLTPSLEVFARGGMLFLDQKSERQIGTSRISHRSGDEIWMAGAGVQWSFASRWATRLEYQLTDDIDIDTSVFSPQAGTTNIEQLSLSLLFEF